MLRNLPSDSQMSKALILGIALASNIGGMLSPIERLKMRLLLVELRQLLFLLMA